MTQEPRIPNSPEFQFWRSLTGEHWESAIASARIIRYNKGEFLYDYTREDHGVFAILLRGQAKISSFSEQGRTICVGKASVGDVCPLHTNLLLGNPKINLRCISESEVHYIVFNRASFLALIKNNPAFFQYVLRKNCELLMALLDLVNQLSFYKLPQRLACHILQNAKFSKNILSTHQTLADNLGTTREMVSRILKTFQDKGYISIERGSVTVLDKQSLAAESKII